MNCFVPFSTQKSPSRVAVVRIAAASLPDEASVSAHDASCSPATSGPRYFCFCASVPNMKMGAEPSPLGAATDNQPKAWLRMTGPDGVYVGPFIVSEWSDDRAHDAEATWSISASSNGDVSFTPA